MTAQIQERVALPPFDDPVLITAFTNPNKGGMTASWAIGNMLAQWDASLVAELEAEGCYNLARLRPQMHRNENRTDIEWPSNLIYAATPPGSDRTFLFLVGVEPTLDWKSFAEAIADFAGRAGVHTAISLRGAPGSVTHRQPGRVLAWYSRPGLQGEYALQPLEMEHGLADIGIVVNRYLQDAGCDVIDLFAIEPFYTPAMPYAKAADALIGALEHAFHVEFDHSQLRLITQQQDQAFDGLVAASDELRAGLEALESQTGPLLSAGDGASGEVSAQTSVVQLDDTPLDADEVLRDVEALLRGGT